MITAIDTNILLDVLLPNDEFIEAAVGTLESCSRDGSLMVCNIVYAELCGHFATRAECDRFLVENDIETSPLNEETCFVASRVWLKYRKQGGNRTRILSDFLIGAHAQTQATRLVSRDAGFYKKLFPWLRLVDPMKA